MLSRQPERWEGLEPRLVATLEFLERLTREPRSVDARAIERALEAGVSPAGLEQAAQCCFVFCVINRLVDAFGADLSPPEAETIAGVLAKAGGALDLVSGKPRPWTRYRGSLPEPLVRQLREIREGVGDCPAEVRVAVEARVAGRAGAERPAPASLPDDVAALVDVVADDAHGVTDEHVECLKASGWSDAAIFELVFVSAFGAAVARLERVIHLLRDR